MFQFVSTLAERFARRKASLRAKARRRSSFTRNLRSEPLEDRRMLAQTVGVFTNELGAYDGYTLFSPEMVHRTYLIDNSGNEVHTWPSNYDARNMSYMQPDGSIWRAGDLGQSQVWPWNAAGVGGIVQQIDWDGRVVSQFRLADTDGVPGADSRILHHDIEVLPNGNVAMIAFDYVSAERAVDGLGRNPAMRDAARANDKHLIPDSIVEVAFDDKGKGNIVWEWHVEDHFVQDWNPDAPNYAGDFVDGATSVAEVPQRIDINYTAVKNNAGVPRYQADITHANALEYIPELDQFLLSTRSYSEVWVIDHNTTTAEAAGPKGDLLYRWGNPEAYGAGTHADQQSFFQHDAMWVPFDAPDVAKPGTFTLYSNGHVDDDSGPQYSAVENFVPPIVLDENGNFVEYAKLEDPYGTGLPIMAWGPVERDAELISPYDPNAVNEDADWITLAKFPNKGDMKSGDERHFSPIISGAHRMPNGNTVVTEGVNGTLFEVTPDNEIVWEYVNPIVPGGRLKQGQVPQGIGFAGLKENFIFKARRYARDYLDEGLIGKPNRIVKDTAGLFDPETGVWYLNNKSDGTIDQLFEFHDETQKPGSDPPEPFINYPSTFKPISGDWDGDGDDTVGLWDNTTNTWYLFNETNDQAQTPIVLQGAPVDPSLRPIAGDWDGPDPENPLVRRDMPGLYDWRTNTWRLYTAYGPVDGNDPDDSSVYDPENPNNFEQSVLVYNGPNHRQRSWRPIAGDWDGDGVDTVGLYVPSWNIWYLNNRTDGQWKPGTNDAIVARGPQHRSPSWLPIAGDWNQNGVDSIGLYVPGANIWYLNNRNDGSIKNMYAFQGPLVPTSWKPVVGNWNGSLPEPEALPPAGGEGEGESAWVGPVAFGNYVQTDLAETELGQAVLPVDALDANVDGQISPLDVLTVVSALNTWNNLVPSSSDQDMDSYPDTNGDMLLSPIDVLLVINHLNQSGVSSGGVVGAEGEASPVSDGGEVARLEVAEVSIPVTIGLSVDSHDRMEQTGPSSEIALPVNEPVPDVVWPAQDRVDDVVGTVFNQYSSTTEEAFEDILDDLAVDIAEAWDA